MRNCALAISIRSRILRHVVPSYKNRILKIKHNGRGEWRGRCESDVSFFYFSSCSLVFLFSCFLFFFFSFFLFFFFLFFFLSLFPPSFLIISRYLFTCDCVRCLEEEANGGEAMYLFPSAPPCPPLFSLPPILPSHFILFLLFCNYLLFRSVQTESKRAHQTQSLVRMQKEEREARRQRKRVSHLRRNSMD